MKMEKRTIDRLESAIDECVLCGLCQPHCPTYAVTENEADSPRGRISIVLALAQGLIPATDAMDRHLNGCLTCLACEDVCPSGVSYHFIITAGRALLLDQINRPTLLSRMMDQFSRRRVVRSALDRLMQLSGDYFVSRLPGNWPLPSFIQDSPSIPFGVSGKNSVGAVYLFTGCGGELFDRQTLQDSIYLLTRMGYEVRVPEEQTCCGAIAGSRGDVASLKKLLRQNQKVFKEAIPIVCTASACALSLQRYEQEWSDQHESVFSVFEICAFVASANWPENLKVAPLKKRVAVHVPCTQKNGLHQSEAAFRLLEKIPDLDIVPLAENARCCGASGTHMLTHPEAAQTMLAPKLHSWLEIDADELVTTNIGCALHFYAGIHRHSERFRVVHPVQLLAAQVRAVDDNAESL